MTEAQGLQREAEGVGLAPWELRQVWGCPATILRAGWSLSLTRCIEGAGMMVTNWNRRGSDRTQGDDFTHNDSLSVAGVGQRGFGVPLHPWRALSPD